MQDKSLDIGKVTTIVEDVMKTVGIYPSCDEKFNSQCQQAIDVSDKEGIIIEPASRVHISPRHLECAENAPGMGLDHDVVVEH